MSVIARSPQAWTPVPADVADEELVRRVRRRDQRAFEAIYERYREPLYRYCHSIMRQREDAEEAFQATMLSAYQALSSGEDREIALRPWLYRIAHNACISALRKRPRHDAAELTGFEAAREDVGAQTEVAEDLRQLQRDLSELPDAQRSALVMRELGGLSHVEIARALGEDATTVKQLIYGARSALHDLAQGRDLACASVRRTLSDGDGRSLRGRGLRAHLGACAGCRSWQAGLHARPAKLAAIAPVLSAAAFHQIFQAITGTAAAAGLGAGMAAATAGAGAVGGFSAGGGAGAIGGSAAAGAGAATSGGLAVKLAAIGTATLIGGGTAAVPALESAAREPAPPARAQVVPATASTPATLVLTSPPPAAPAAAGAPGLARAEAVRQEAATRMAERAAGGGPAVERTMGHGPRGGAANLQPGTAGARAARGEARGRAARALGNPAPSASERAVTRMQAASQRAQTRRGAPAATPAATPAALGAGTVAPERPAATDRGRGSLRSAPDAPVTPVVPAPPTDPTAVSTPVVPTVPVPETPLPTVDPAATDGSPTAPGPGRRRR